VDDDEQTEAERRQDSANLAWHSTAAHQALTVTQLQLTTLVVE